MLSFLFKIIDQFWKIYDRDEFHWLNMNISAWSQNRDLEKCEDFHVHTSINSFTIERQEDDFTEILKNLYTKSLYMSHLN